MDEEKTLLQQIRDREQEFARKLEQTKAETEAEVAAARERAGQVLADAERTGKAAADTFRKTEAEATAAAVARVKEDAAAAAEAAKRSGERNFPRAADAIAGYAAGRKS